MIFSRDKDNPLPSPKINSGIVIPNQLRRNTSRRRQARQSIARAERVRGEQPVIPRNPLVTAGAINGNIDGHSIGNPIGVVRVNPDEPILRGEVGEADIGNGVVAVAILGNVGEGMGQNSGRIRARIRAGDWKAVAGEGDEHGDAGEELIRVEDLGAVAVEGEDVGEEVCVKEGGDEGEIVAVGEVVGGEGDVAAPLAVGFDTVKWGRKEEEEE